MNEPGEKRVHYQYINEENGISTLTLSQSFSDYLHWKIGNVLQWIQEEHDKLIEAIKSGPSRQGQRQLSQRKIGNEIRSTVLNMVLADSDYIEDL